LLPTLLPLTLMGEQTSLIGMGGSCGVAVFFADTFGYEV
jgi:hypothetical protein